MLTVLTRLAWSCGETEAHPPTANSAIAGRMTTCKITCSQGSCWHESNEAMTALGVSFSRRTVLSVAGVQSRWCIRSSASMLLEVCAQAWKHVN